MPRRGGGIARGQESKACHRRPNRYDALLKCFCEECLERFLRDSGIAGTFVAQLDMTESKRTWLDRLFPLVSDHEKGAEVLLAMGRTLASTKSFPDLEGWEDSAQKIQVAREAVRTLADALRTGRGRRIAQPRRSNVGLKNFVRLRCGNARTSTRSRPGWTNSCRRRGRNEEAAISRYGSSICLATKTSITAVLTTSKDGKSMDRSRWTGRPT